jgi:hypothetical protein
MKGKFRRTVLVTFVSVFVLCLIGLIPVTAKGNDQCDKHWYYADTQVGWCIPDGWTGWSRESGATDADLAQNLQDMYNISRTDIYDLGLPMVAMLMHPTMNKYAVYAQLYVSDYPNDGSTPEDIITNTYITSDGTDLYFTVNNDYNSLKGLLFKKYDKYSRAWILYPMEQLGKVYMVAIFAPNKAWDNSTDVGKDIEDIGFRLYITEEPSPNVSQGQSNSQGNSGNSQKGVLVFHGGRITSVDYSTKTVQDSTQSSDQVTQSDSINKTFPSATWEFHKDGTVTFTPLGIGSTLRDDLYPVTGTYQVNNANISVGNGKFSIEGGEIVFTLYRESNTGGNKAYVSISGTINNTTGETDIYYQVSNGMSADSVQGGRTQVITINAHFTEDLSR